MGPSQAHLAFHLTGRRTGATLDPVDTAALRPALLAQYEDLAALRYDFPLVLADVDGGFVVSLSEVCDRVLHEIARGEDGTRLSHHVLRVEREIRTAVAAGVRGSLSALWSRAAARVSAAGDPLVTDSLDRARAALAIDGEVVDCDAELPAHLLTHAWSVIQRRKAAAFRKDVETLQGGLKDILRADEAHSAEGCRADRLRAAMGGADDTGFDFDALSRVLTTAAPAATLPPSRRRRIEGLIAALTAQDFYPAQAVTFSRPSAALAAHRGRLSGVAAMAKAMAIAELETQHAYREDRHDALFEHAGPDTLDPRDLAAFPDYLVSVNASDLDPAEQSALLELLSAGLPVKVVLQWDDILDESPVGDGHLALDPRSRQVATTAMSAGDAYVVQAPSSQLYQVRERLLAGMAYQGPALFSVFSGAGGDTDGLPPYLSAAAALESRAFPAFSYDPDAGSDWASRFSLDANPQLDLDWPVQPFAFEDGRHQRTTVPLAFTLADFVALDRRGARHFARVAASDWNGAFTPVDQAVLAGAHAAASPVPALWMVDRARTLQQVVVDERLLREARRCRDQWRSLQELGGVHNSHAERLIARERRRAAAVPADPAPAAPTAPDVAETAPVPAEAASAPAPGQPYIETPRCSTCNECTTINPNMFAYNENRQAYIKNPDAGTFAQLVEAAESCQLSIIHPGAPRDANEPGLAELVERAKAFQ